jgi:hypothetical protein
MNAFNLLTDKRQLCSYIFEKVGVMKRKMEGEKK